MPESKMRSIEIVKLSEIENIAFIYNVYTLTKHINRDLEFNCELAKALIGTSLRSRGALTSQ